MKLAVISHLLLTIAILAAALESEIASASNEIRVAMSAAFVSEDGIGIYQELTEHLNRALPEKKFEFINGLAYETINQMILDGAIHVGFVCGLPYVLLKEKGDIDLLAAPVMVKSRYNGKPVYFSDLIVHKSSDARSIQDLKNKHFIFNEEISNSGYNLPRNYFSKNGIIGTNFFGKISRSGSHEASIRAVGSRKADFSFVDSLVLEFDRHLGKPEAMNVKVIQSLGPSGIPPVVASTKVDPKVRQTIRTQLLNMHKDPKGREILKKAFVKKFVPVSHKNYEDIWKHWNDADRGRQSIH